MQLNVSDNSIENFIENLPFAYLKLSINGNILSHNVKAEMLFDSLLANAGLVGVNIDELFSDGSDVKRFFRDVVENNSHLKIYEHNILLMNGDNVGANIFIFQDVGDGGFVNLYIDPLLLAVQINRQKLHDEVVARSGLMVAMLSHEIKNPLTSIKGAAQLINNNITNNNNNIKELSNVILKEADRAKNTLNNVEFLSDSSEIALNQLNIHEVLHYAMSVIDPVLLQHIEVKEDFDPSLPLISGNYDLLVQLFVNLLKNAAEAVVEGVSGGKIKGYINIKTLYRNDYNLRYNKDIALPICVRIENNGKAIDKKLQNTLFDPFVSTKPSGNGLGLAISAKIIKDHNAMIRLVESNENQTVFEVLLPVDK